MPVQQAAEQKFPLIDADPHFSRVVRYMRPDDVGVIGLSALAFPGLLYAYEMADPSLRRKAHLRPALKMCVIMGTCAGFLLAYQRSSFRFWGWTENAREQKRDMEELSALARQGKPVYGTSDLPEFVQGAAHRNSVWSQMKFAALPWFNFVNHPHHGVDTAKYYMEKEE